MDSSASDQMTNTLSLLEYAIVFKDNSLINLSTSETSKISHRIIILKSNIRLNNVLYIPAFKHKYVIYEQIM